MSLDCDVVVTASGARAMRDRLTGELMHPLVGPLVEAPRLYIEPSRLAERLSSGESREPLVLLDVGLGAGSNAIHALRLAESLSRVTRRLSISSFDRSLLALKLALEPEHRAAFGFEGDAFHAGASLLERGSYESERVSWRIILGELVPSLEALALEQPESADVVYWDPFSPRKNPELWTLCAFSALRAVCREGVTLHTYSRATSVRTALLLAGFSVGESNVFENGRQGTCAALRVSDLEHPLGPRFLERLGRSTAPFPPDAPPDALARIARLPQFAR
jgi:queuine tRNA-ribosyltransferase